MIGLITNEDVGHLACIPEMQNTLNSVAPKMGPQAKQVIQRVQFRLALLVSTGVCYYRVASVRLSSR